MFVNEILENNYRKYVLKKCNIFFYKNFIRDCVLQLFFFLMRLFSTLSTINFRINKVKVK